MKCTVLALDFVTPSIQSISEPCIKKNRVLFIGFTIPFELFFVMLHVIQMLLVPVPSLD